MKIILLHDVPKVGKKWEVKNVADGFAQNALIPKKLAEMATPPALARAVAARASSEASRAASAEELGELAKTLASAPLEISAKANEQGHLFAALHEGDIARAIQQKTGVAISPELLKSAHPIKTVGEHLISIQTTDTTFRVTLLPS